MVCQRGVPQLSQQSAGKQDTGEAEATNNRKGSCFRQLNRSRLYLIFVQCSPLSKPIPPTLLARQSKDIYDRMTITRIFPPLALQICFKGK